MAGLSTGASLQGCCGIFGGICCSVLPGCCQYKCGSLCGCSPRYSWYFLPRGHIDHSGTDLAKMRVWIEQGWIKPEVSLVVGMNDIDRGLSQMDSSYRTFGMSEAEGAKYEVNAPETHTGKPHRGKVVIRVQDATASDECANKKDE